MLLGDDVIERAPFVAAAAPALARRLDAQHDEAVLTGELLLAEQPAGVLSGADERGGEPERLGLARRPRVAIRVQVPLAARARPVPDDLLRPDDVVEDVPVVEAEDVVLPGGRELARLARSEQLVPRPE